MVAGCPKIFEDVFVYTDWPNKVRQPPGARDIVEQRFDVKHWRGAVKFFGSKAGAKGKSCYRTMHLFEERGQWWLASVICREDSGAK